MSITLYNTFAVMIVLAAVFAYINHRFIRMPNTIAIMILSLITSFIIICIGWYNPSIFFQVTSLIKSVDFYTVLMRMMLSFLLFAGSIHIKAYALKEQAASVFTFSTIGVLISTFVIGGLFYIVTGFFNMQISFVECLLFGALISPTDPIAVLSILKEANIPRSLEVKITGESLFNDGVSIVVFITILNIINGGTESLSWTNILLHFLKEAGGGILLGAIVGYTGFIALRSIDNYKVEALITIAIVMGGYLLADVTHVSGALAMVVAGIITGNKSREKGMSEITRDYVDRLWELIDEILNAILFLLMGLEMIVIPFNLTVLWLGLITIVIVLAARFAAIAIPITFLKMKMPFEKNAIAILTWSGLRGGISVALALSLQGNNYGNVFIPITYIVVLFSIIVQGLTIGKLAKKFSGTV
jgi:CPA1 family monovalent cation:H+ antiporter